MKKKQYSTPFVEVMQVNALLMIGEATLPPVPSPKQDGTFIYE